MLVNGPVPEPSVVWEPVATGPVVVLQQTPLAVTDAPPEFVTLPPVTAEVRVNDETAEVVTVGATADVVNDTSFP